MNCYVLLRNSPSSLKSPKKVEEHNFFHQSQDISSELRFRTYYFMFYVKTMTVKDTMDYSFQVKNCQIKIYTVTRRLKLRAGHFSLTLVREPIRERIKRQQYITRIFEIFIPLIFQCGIMLYNIENLSYDVWCI